ncbi:SH3 domain-containing protein [Clostridium sp.]|uniref:SH3 domain-containing protein n=1 Tax=Clostridium sp. TaxID=1506 RepID=UPI0026085136
MAVAIVQQQQQQPPNDKINIDLSNSNVAVVKNTKETKLPIKDEKQTNSNDNLEIEKKTEPKIEEKSKAKVDSKEENKAKVKTESKVKEDTSEKKSSYEIKEEIKNQKPVIKEIKLPVKKDLKNSSENLSTNSNEFASDVNRRLYEYESVRSNQSNAMNEAIRLHNGDSSNTCVFFQGACLRAIGVPVPSHIGYTSNLWNWLENNNWEMHRDFSNLQKGDIIFAGEYHTMCFMGWKDKANGIAYVMGNEAYTYGDAYAHRNLNGQAPTKENGWNRQYKATRYYKYKGNSSKGNENSDIVKTNIVTSNPVISKNHNYTVKSLKGTVTAKQDVYVNEKPFPTTEGINPVVLAKGGDKLTVTGRASNGWYEVLYNGKKAYISNRYTNFLEEKEAPSKESNKKVEESKPTTPNKTLEESKDNKESETSKPALTTVKTAYVKANGGLWLHSSKDSYISSRLAIMDNGEKVTILEESGDWFKVNYNGKTGFCASKYLSEPTSHKSKVVNQAESNKTEEIKANTPSKAVEESKTNDSKSTEESKPVLTNVKRASVKANGGLWLHSTKDSSASSRITIMGNGEKVDILDESDSWYKVNYNGTMGWCSSQFLSNKTVISENSQSKHIEKNKTVQVIKPVTSSSIKTSYIKANGGLWLHSTKDSSASSRITIMNKGSKVRVLEESGCWFKVDYNGNTGWCASKFLTNPVTSQSNVVEESKPAHLAQSNISEMSLKSAHIKANGGLWLHSSKDSSTSSRLTVMGNGHRVEILEKNGDWYKVRYNGNIGWCSSRFIV